MLYRSLAWRSIEGSFFPLVGMTGEAVVTDGVAEVALVQFFQTVGAESLPPGFETRYQIPIDESAAVHKFEASYDEPKITADVEDSRTAEQEFQEALDDGKPAFLGDQDEPGLFVIQFGNVPLDRLIQIKITYVVAVTSLDSTQQRFLFWRNLQPKSPQPCRCPDKTVLILKVASLSSK